MPLTQAACTFWMWLKVLQCLQATMAQALVLVLELDLEPQVSQLPEHTAALLAQFYL